MWFKKHDKILKIGVIAVTLVIAIVVINDELNTQRQIAVQDEINKVSELFYAKERPFYDCLIAAASMADENSPISEIQKAVNAGDACYTRYKPF